MKLVDQLEGCIDQSNLVLSHLIWVLHSFSVHRHRVHTRSTRDVHYTGSRSSCTRLKLTPSPADIVQTCTHSYRNLVFLFSVLTQNLVLFFTAPLSKIPCENRFENRILVLYSFMHPKINFVHCVSQHFTQKTKIYYIEQSAAYNLP